MKKVSSVVWQFFDRLEENKRCVAVLCKLCDTEYKYFGNTTNLRGHLMKKHPIQWELRQASWDGPKTLGTNITFEDDEAAPKRRKYQKDKNVRYSLSIKNGSETAGGDSIPRIEVQRVDVLENSDADDHAEDEEATINLVRHLHETRRSDEEWLDEDYATQEVYESKRKPGHIRTIKREVVTPPRRVSNYYARTMPKTEIASTDNTKKDEYSVFGEYIANKLRKFKAPRTRGNIQQIITTILWQAEYGYYDDAEAVKRVLMASAQDLGTGQHTAACGDDSTAQSDQSGAEKTDEVNQIEESEETSMSLIN